jgi:hypothetical protein
VFTLDALLATNNLKAGDVNINAQGFASGISKMIDNAEMLEERNDQIDYFLEAEKELFNEKLKKYLLPYWNKANLLAPEMRGVFTEDFKLKIKYHESQVVASEQERVKIAIDKINAKLSSRKEEIKRLNPDLSATALELLIAEIEGDLPNASGSFLDEQLQSQVEDKLS